MILICNMTDDIMAKLKKQILYVKKLCFKNKVPYSKDMPLFVDDSLNPIKLDLFTKRFAHIRDFYNIILKIRKVVKKVVKIQFKRKNNAFRNTRKALVVYGAEGRTRTGTL